MEQRRWRERDGSRWLWGRIAVLVALVLAPASAGIGHTGQVGDLGSQACDVSESRFTFKCESWAALSDGPTGGSDLGTMVELDPDGQTVYAIGYGQAQPQGTDTLISARDTSSGEERWNATHGGSGDGIDVPMASAIDPDGQRVYVTVMGLGEDSYDYGTVAFDADSGEVAWFDEYDDAGGWDIPRAMAVSPDGERVYVTGGGETSGSTRYATVAYDAATGEQAWAAHATSAGSDDGTSVAVSPDSQTVYVTGIMDGDPATIAYDAATGEEVWRAHAHGWNRDYTAYIDVAPGGEHVFVATASEGGSTGPSYTLAAYRADTGDQAWAVDYDSGAADELGAFRVGPQGDVLYTTGQRSPSAPSLFGLVRPLVPAQVQTVAFDASTGQPLWANVHQGVPVERESGDDLAISPSGEHVYATGTVAVAGEAGDQLTIAYDASTGETVWTARYDGGADDAAHAVGIGPTGERLFVVGLSATEGGTDVSTLMYTTQTPAGLNVIGADE